MMKFSVTDVCCGSCLYINIAQETLAPAFARGGGERGAAMAARSTSNAAGSGQAELIGFSDSAVHMSTCTGVCHPTKTVLHLSGSKVRQRTKLSHQTRVSVLQTINMRFGMFFVVWKIRSSSEKVQKLL